MLPDRIRTAVDRARDELRDQCNCRWLSLFAEGARACNDCGHACEEQGRRCRYFQ